MGDAVKRVNQLREEFGIPLQNPEYTSQYKGVTWHRKTGKWKVQLWLNEGKIEYGGYFIHELDAGKRVNELCEKLRIRLQNPEISAIPNQLSQKDEKKSQYKGVYWHKKSGKWYAQIYLKGQKIKYGGSFKDELNAANRVNQLCEELEIPPQNPTISAIPNQKYKKSRKTSQYKGVSWNREKRKWQVQLQLKGQKQQYGGYFKEEVDAAKKVNQLCETLGIPLQHPE